MTTVSNARSGLCPSEHGAWGHLERKRARPPHLNMEYQFSKPSKSIPFGGKRTDRVGDQIKMEVADILLRKAKDPRIERVTVLSVDLSPDLAHAKVYISVPPSVRPAGIDSKDNSIHEKAALVGLNNAKGFIRSELARRLPLKRVPDISFLIDQSERRVSRLLALLEDVGEEQVEKEDETGQRQA